MQSIRCGFTMFFSIPLVIGSVIIVGGCEQKEKVIDIETPAGNIEVERTNGSGKVDVDIKLDRK